MTQYGLPASNYALSNWAEGAGDGDGDFFDELDEGFGAGRGSGSGPDDDTAYWVTTDESSNWLQTNLSAITDPEVDTGHKYRTRNRKNSANGRQLDCTIIFFEASAQRATEVFTNIDNVWTTREGTVAEAQATLISNYHLLRIRTAIIETGGGSPKIGWESAHEFECPDAGAGPGYYQLQYTSEPPTPNAWNQLKQDAGSGDYIKLFYEGE